MTKKKKKNSQKTALPNVQLTYRGSLRTRGAQGHSNTSATLVIVTYDNRMFVCLADSSAQNHAGKLN